MRRSQVDHGFERIATLDIETTHYDPGAGETVSIGVGVHDRGTASADATYELFHRRSEGDEGRLIERALGRLDEWDADALVTYNGREFDLPFLADRRGAFGLDPIRPALDAPETHLDLFDARKRELAPNQQWPSLEGCLRSYGFEVPDTVWEGAPVTNVRFGEELGPAYLASVRAGDERRQTALLEVIDHYLLTDLEANVALYYADVGERFEPAYLGPVGDR